MEEEAQTAELLAEEEIEEEPIEEVPTDTGPIEDINGDFSDKPNGKRTQIRRELKHPLPDARVTVERQIKILRSLNIAGGKGKTFVSAKEVATFAGMHYTIISGVLAFYFNIGLLDKETNSYKPRQEIIDFCNELEWNEGAAGKALGKAFSTTWFGDYIPKIFILEKEITREQLIKNLGSYAGADQYHKNQITRLIDLLEYGELISFDEETKKYIYVISLEENPPLLAENKEEVKKPEIVEGKKEIKKVEKPQEKVPKIPNIPKKENLQKEISIKNGDSLKININLSIGEDSDIDTISEKIFKLKKKLGMI